MKSLGTLVAAAFLAGVPGAGAQGTVTVKDVPQGKTLSKIVIQANAPVVAINQETREVTFKRPDGTLRTVVAGDEVKNLAQISVGDVIKVRYQEAVSIRLDKSSGGTPAISESSGISRNPPGSKPGGEAAHELTISASIVRINALDSEVTLKGPRGGELDVLVPDHAMLGRLNVGDLVVLTYTEALALSVEKVPAS